MSNTAAEARAELPLWDVVAEHGKRVLHRLDA